MKLTPCPHESEVRKLVARGQWPTSAQTDPELHAHVTGCRTCSDLVLIAEAFSKARAESVAAARPGSAGALWWRAQLRRRNAAVERITRPLFGAQIFALAVTLVAGVGLAVLEARSGVSWLTRLEQLPQSAAAHWNELLTTGTIDQGWGLLVLMPALAMLLLLGGVAVYLATDRQ